MTTPHTMKECPNCHNANQYGDYEGPTCEVCLGDGFVPDDHAVTFGRRCECKTPDECAHHDL